MNSIAYGALWIFVFSVPWERALVLPGLSIVPRVTGGLALCLALLAIVMTGRVRRWHTLHIAALLFWLWAGAGLLFFHEGGRLPYKFWTYGQLLLVIWMMWELAPAIRQLRGLFVAYVLGSCVAAFETIMLYRREAEALKRFAAGGSDPNDLAMTLALAVPMAWYLASTTPNALLRWSCRAYLPVAVVTVGLTGSRGGMLAMTIALLILPLSMTRLSPKKLAAAVFTLAVAGAVAAAYVPQTLIARLADTRAEVDSGDLGGRGKLWVAGVQVFTESPIIGHGTGMFRPAITPILGKASQVAHNSYLSVLVEEGMIGFSLYMMMFVAVFFSVLNLRLLERRFALVLLATLGLALLPLTWEDRRVVWFILAVLLGFSEAHLRRPLGISRQAPWARPAPIAGAARTPRTFEGVAGRGRSQAGDALA